MDSLPLGKTRGACHARQQKTTTQSSKSCLIDFVPFASDRLSKRAPNRIEFMPPRMPLVYICEEQEAISTKEELAQKAAWPPQARFKQSCRSTNRAELNRMNNASDTADRLDNGVTG